MIALGIDVGTTHTKVLALDVATGATLALESGPTPIRKDDAGEAHRAADVLELVIDLIGRVVRAIDDADDVVALCVASVGEEVVLLDDAGHPVGDTIAWYDPRGFEEAATFATGQGGRVALSRRWPPDPTFSLFKLMWTRDHRREEYAAATSWTDLGDFVLMGLGADLVMDWSHASRAGAFDLLDRAWDRQSIEAARLDITFPRLVASRTVIGHVSAGMAARTGLPTSVAIVTGGHDHLCAAYGAGVRSTAELFLSAGTSEAHLALIEAPLEGEAGRDVDQGCFVDADRYYVHINIHSGHFFKQWRQLLYGDTDDATMYAEISATPAGAADISFEPTDELRHARLDHVPYDADRGLLMRAVLEGLARRSASIVDQLEATSGSPYELILAAGHPTRVGLWRRLRLAAYGRPMAAVEEPESAAFGAAVMAAQAVRAPGADDLMARRVAWSDGEHILKGAPQRSI
jgi:sugar (pentulose or hexulose) kinase